MDYAQFSGQPHHSALAMATKKSAERHESHCTICKHGDRAQIEAEFLSWRSPAQIAREFRLGSRQVVYRHMQAMGLFLRRKSDVRAAFQTFIERSLSRQTIVPPSVGLAAAIALSKLDSEGKTLERFEQVNSHQAFLNDARWTRGEMLHYAETGELPPWYEELPDTQYRDSSSSKFRN